MLFRHPSFPESLATSRSPTNLQIGYIASAQVAIGRLVALTDALRNVQAVMLAYTSPVYIAGGILQTDLVWLALLLYCEY